jgi:uncharacterized membrane protein
VAESLFQLLFKYRPVVFSHGSFALGTPWPWLLVLALVVAASVPAVLLYSRTRGRLDRRDRLVLSALRVGALGILAFCLLRPMLVIATVVPQENFLGVLLDDSRSMQVADRDGEARRAYVTHEFGSPQAPLVAALADRFKLRFFRFSDIARRLGDSTELAFDGRRTDLGRALDAARRELGGVPLAGLVVVTDGAQNGATGSLSQTVLQLQADGVPVYPVGVGQARFSRDIAVRRAAMPRRVLVGSSVAVDVTVTQSGFGGSAATLVVEDGRRILATREVPLPREGEAATVRVHFTAEEPGPRRVRFRIAPREGEAIVANNALESLLLVDVGRQRILYLEGEPRFETKFLRRAVADDPQLRVVVLQRTADEKFYAIDVDAEDDLAAGFPSTREELFRYDGAILGTVEASFFTHDQLGMLADFVNRRGGGLLALGGRRSFVEGGYAGTPLAEALPVPLERGADRDTGGFVAEVKVRPTPFGLTHPATQLATEAEQVEDRWDALPPLTVVNPIVDLKPGASLLLEGRSDAVREPLIVLAYQRYGRGKAVVLPVQDTWLWQMHADIPVDDLTHETFWRQLLRWLVADVPQHVTVTTGADRVERGSSLDITAEIADSGYLRVNGADVRVRIVAPDGAESTVPMEWSVERDGEYRTSFVPEQDGLYELRVDATRDGSPLGAAVSYVEAGDLDSELRDAEMQESALRRIADETGGRFYTPETVHTLPEDVSFTESGTTLREERDLWDMPILLLGLLALVGTEWVYRRRRGLA